MSQLSLNQVNKIYGDSNTGVHAVRDLSMTVEPGEIVALLGSSGCGKTSTLRMIAGFEEVSAGSIELKGKQVHALAPNRRNVAMAFEGYSLYPPLTVRENIAFALKASKLSAGEIDKRIDHITELLEIGGILDNYPTSLSGGQQQRASLGRALVREADLHLLDEPMGQLEPQLRAVLRGRLKHHIKERGVTAILVTHDQTEANALADRIAVMEDGALQQFDTPEIIKTHPANLFSGTFIGEPPMNVFDATAQLTDNQLLFVLPDNVELSYPIDQFNPALIDVLKQQPDCVIGVRPYAVQRDGTGLAATISANQWLGDQTHIATEFAGGSLVLVEHDRVDLQRGGTIHVHFPADKLHIFNPQDGQAIAHGQVMA